MNDDESITLVNSLPLSSLEEFNSLLPDNFKHYMTCQTKWFQECRYYVGTVLHRVPSEMEVIAHWESNNNPVRFKAYYFLRYQFRDAKSILEL